MVNKKSIWAKLAAIPEDILSQEGENIEIAKRAIDFNKTVNLKKETVVAKPAEVVEPKKVEKTAESPKNKKFSSFFEKLKKKNQKPLKKKEEDKKEKSEDSWLEQDFPGQLSVDVCQEGDSLIIQSTIAGVEPDNLDISVEPDLITIRGARQKETTIKDKNYFYQECFWGKFSRTLVLPYPVQPDKVKAKLKNGILTIILPIVQEENSASIKID